MKRKILFILPVILLILQSCVSGPYTSEGQVELMKNYFNSENSSDWILVKIGEWEYDCYMRGEKQICRWGRNEKWYNPNSRLISSTGIAFNEKTYKQIQECGEHEVAYIGNWEYSNKLNNYIRPFLICANIRFEQMDKNNKNIKAVKFDEKKFKIPAFNLAKIRWYEKYGYNAYYDRETGEIKQAVE